MAHRIPQSAPVRRARRDAIRAVAFDPTWAAVAVATLVALVLWLVRLSTLPLFIDEGASWSVASQSSLGEFWRLLLNQEVAPPPFYAGLRVLVEYLGADGHAAMRLPVLLLTLPTVPLTAILARQVGAGRTGVISAAWLLALSPLVLMFAQQVRAYGPALTLTVLAAVLLFRAQDRGWAKRDALAAGLATGAAPWTHYVALLPLGVLLLSIAWQTLRPVRWAFWVPVALGWIGALVFAKVQYDHVGAGLDGSTRPGGLDLRRVLATAWDTRGAIDETRLWAAIPALLVVGLVGLLVRGRPATVAVAGLVGPLAIVVISAVGPDIVSTRYLICAVPFLLVSIAVAADRFRPALIVVVALLIVGAQGIYRSLDPATGSYPNAEAILQGVLPDLRPGDVVASDDITLANWLPTYIAERNGIPDIGTAWGSDQLGRAACKRRHIRQIIPGTADRAQAVTAWKATGYTATAKNLPTPGLLLISADPTGTRPTICDSIAGR